MGFKNLFWAFIFLFDFNLNGFDILPDIIGYILFYRGLKMLSERNENFAKGKILAIPLIFLSILDIFHVTIPINKLGIAPFGRGGFVIGIVKTIINLMMIYRICMGIAEEARVINDSELELKANNEWKLYLIVNIALLVSIFIPVLMGVLFIAIFIFSIAVYFLMLGLMNMASKRLE